MRLHKSENSRFPLRFKFISQIKRVNSRQIAGEHFSFIIKFLVPIDFSKILWKTRVLSKTQTLN